MQRFLRKTKKRFVIGIGTIKDKENDLLFDEKEKILKDYQEMLSTFQDAVNDYMGMIKRIGNVSSKLGDVMSHSSLIDEDTKKHKFEGEQMRALCLKICNLIEVFTRNIFDEQQQIINSIKVIREKRKKNKILKVQEAKNYEKAKKNKKDIQKYEEAYRRRTQKFENYQYQFVYDVEMLNNGKTEFIKKIFGAILFYSKEIIEVQNNVIDSIFIKYCSEPIKSLFPTCNAAEPKFEEISYGNDENLI